MPVPPPLSRLQREWQRLYAPTTNSHRLVDDAGQVRAMVLELARPADWALLSRVWNGVQADLDWPAPAIAVSGRDGLQLWFSLSAPAPAAQARALLEALRQRYLGDIPAKRVALLPALDPLAPGQVRHAAAVPLQQAGSGNWSAFVAPDLAAVFADEPWLGMCPNPEGQAKLLAGLTSAPLCELQQALEMFRADAAGAARPPPERPTQSSAAAAAAVTAAASAGAPGGPLTAEQAGATTPPEPPALPDAHLSPKRFLLDVLHNEAVPLALRIEAAKALLPYV